MRYSLQIDFRSFDSKRSLPGQNQQVLIAADQYIRISAVGQVEEWLIPFVSANQDPLFGDFDHRTVGQIVREQFQSAF